MNHMEDINNQTQPNANDLGSATAGSLGAAGNGPTQTDGSGQPQGNTVDKKIYEELESKLGTQGQELGEYRAFMKSIEPLLDKLDAQPELIKMIIDGKVTADVLKGLEEGTVTPAAAQAVTKAHEDVKKELGKEGYEKASPEEVKKLVAEQVQAAMQGVTKTIEESKELQDFERFTNDFIKSTPDFAEYAANITQWFEEHPEQDDIRIAYEAVKGRVLAEKYKDDINKASIEAAKEFAANAAGGSSQSTGTPGGIKDIDKYIGGNVNPNFRI
jgi:hypothetical protein